VLVAGVGVWLGLMGGLMGEGFEMGDGEVVVFVGGSRMCKQVESGFLETLLTRLGGGEGVVFRDLSWQADTVYRRQRPLNFGTQGEWLGRVGATVVVSAFGQMEALDGVERLPEFLAAYEVVLAEIAERAGRIVLVTPTPFGRVDDPHLPDLTRDNDVVAAYGEAIRELALRLGYSCVDLSDADMDGMTVDGVQLTEAGQEVWAKQIAGKLLGELPAYGVDESGAFEDGRMEGMRQAIMAKNVLWRRHWRPTNWAFAYGDRQHVPSSHDHRPGKERWFPAELAAILPEIEAAEGRIEILNEE
jgi:hypothetical protein